MLEGYAAAAEAIGTATAPAFDYGPVFTLLGIVVSGFIAWKMAQLKVPLDQIHVAVNSKETATALELKQLREVILELTKDKAKSEQRELIHQVTPVAPVAPIPTVDLAALLAEIKQLRDEIAKG